MKRALPIAMLLLSLLLAVESLPAATSPYVSHQGRLTDPAGDPVADGAYLIMFQIYADSVGGVPLWSSHFQSVQVTGGLFSYLLGRNVPFPSDLFSSGADRYLGITVGVDAEITPRTQMVAAAYALQAANADNVADGAITDVDVNAAAAITATKIAGTAATLSATQAFTGTNTHYGTLVVGDSTFRANSQGVKIGDAGTPSSDHLLRVERNYNTTNTRYGIRSGIANSLAGTMFAGRFSVLSSAPASTHSVYALDVMATSDGSSRYGLFTYTAALTGSITTGSSYGVYGSAFDGATAYGVYGYAYSATTNWSGYFQGNCNVTGTLSKGGGSFRIDHPLDPENKYLQHSFVESPDMMNIYNGNIVTDDKGYATIEMPAYFDALNRDFRYQLTVIGQFAQAIVAQKLAGGRFVIQTDKPNVEVSWMVTGIRHDKWANANRIQVEVDKLPEQQGKYAHPAEWGQPEEMGVDWENMQAVRDARDQKR